MSDNRILEITLEWLPPYRKKGERPRRSWEGGIQKAMSDRNLEEQQWHDRKK